MHQQTRVYDLLDRSRHSIDPQVREQLSALESQITALYSHPALSPPGTRSEASGEDHRGANRGRDDRAPRVPQSSAAPGLGSREASRADEQSSRGPSGPERPLSEEARFTPGSRPGPGAALRDLTANVRDTSRGQLHSPPENRDMEIPAVTEAHRRARSGDTETPPTKRGVKLHTSLGSGENRQEGGYGGPGGETAQPKNPVGGYSKWTRTLPDASSEEEDSDDDAKPGVTDGETKNKEGPLLSMIGIRSRRLL